MQREAEGLEASRHLQLAQRRLALLALDAVDKVAACAVLHDDKDGAAAVEVLVQEQVVKTNHVLVPQPLQAARLEQRLVRRVHVIARNLLDHVRLAAPRDERCVAEAAAADEPALDVLALAPSTRAWLLSVPLLPDHAAYPEAANEHGAAGDVQANNEGFGELDGDRAAVRVVPHFDARRRHAPSHRFLASCSFLGKLPGKLPPPR